MTESLFKKLLSPVEELTSGVNITYGSRVQILPAEIPQEIEKETLPEEEFVLSLAPNLIYSNKNEEIDENFFVTIGLSRYASIRNTFRITNPEDRNDCSLLKYNDDFYLESVTDPQFVLYSTALVLEQPNVGFELFYSFDYTKGNLDQPVGICAPPFEKKECRHFDCLPKIAPMHCRWKFVHFHPEFRFEFEGEPVQFGAKVLIVHSGTNKLLSPDFKHRKLTSFGSEFGVSAKYRDIRRRFNESGNVRVGWRISSEKLSQSS